MTAEAYLWLAAAAVEVNQVFNWANATSLDAADRNRRANAKFLSGFGLCYLCAGATEFFDHIGADTIQRICREYAAKRRAAKRLRLGIQADRLSAGGRQDLNPVQTVLGAAPGGEGEAHFREARIHDVFAVSRAVEPALDDFIDRRRAVGDVLAH